MQCKSTQKERTWERFLSPQELKDISDGLTVQDVAPSTHIISSPAIKIVIEEYEYCNKKEDNEGAVDERLWQISER